MGMFDYLELVGPNDAVLCAEGHECRSLQTKDMPYGCMMYTYYVCNGVLYKLNESDEYYGWSDFVAKQDLIGPVLFRGRVIVNAYTTCRQCKPKYINKNELYPWVEYMFEFEGGVLTCNPEPVRWG